MVAGGRHFLTFFNTNKREKNLSTKKLPDAHNCRVKLRLTLAYVNCTYLMTC